MARSRAKKEKSTHGAPILEENINFDSLSTEIRQQIFSYAVLTERPFLIGRCQEDKHNNSSPRDIHTFRPNSKFKVCRDDTRNRPIQPGITRVCRAFRVDALPLFYRLNKFWLIHNEFQPEDGTQNLPRRYEAWLSQTRREMFNLMQCVSLCGYVTWPNRIMVTFDLKRRNVLNTRFYSTYANEMGEWRSEETQKVLDDSRDEDGLTALKAVLKYHDGIPMIHRNRVDAPPGMMSIKPANGWYYDW